MGRYKTNVLKRLRVIADDRDEIDGFVMIEPHADNPTRWSSPPIPRGRCRSIAVTITTSDHWRTPQGVAIMTVTGERYHLTELHPRFRFMTAEAFAEFANKNRDAYTQHGWPTGLIMPATTTWLGAIRQRYYELRPRKGANT